MKRLKNSVLFFRINPDTDKVKILYIYNLGWFNLKYDYSEFDINEISMSKIVDCYKTLEEKYDRQYRI